MSELAATHLRQGRSFLRAGDAERAIGLLEKARVLSRNHRELQADVLEELASACDAAGRWDDATRWRDQAARLRPAGAVGARASGGFVDPITPYSQRRRWSFAGIVGVTAAAVLITCLIGAGLLWRYHAQPVAHQLDAQAVAPVALAPAPAPAPVVPATQPAAPAPAPSMAVAAPAPQTRPGEAHDRQQLLKETVGMCVMIVRYEGPSSNGPARIDIPVGSGTAFAVNRSGLMLTNRHVVELGSEPGEQLPPTLAAAGLPTLSLRGTSFVVCFGSDPKDRCRALVLHKSDQYDMAVLKVDRKFDQPLVLATKRLRQGDDITVCGFPGAVMAALNRSAATPAKIIEATRKWQTLRQVDAFDEFSADSFNSTLTRGIVSAPERNVRGVGYVQIDAAISPGNSGGPVLNLQNEVVGIATFGLRNNGSGLPANYNFALLPDQLSEELQPYMRN